MNMSTKGGITGSMEGIREESCLSMKWLRENGIPLSQDVICEKDRLICEYRQKKRFLCKLYSLDSKKSGIITRWISVVYSEDEAKRRNRVENVNEKTKAIRPWRKDKLVKIVIPRISCYDMQKRLCASSNVLLCNDIYMLMELCGINSISSSEHVDLLQAKKNIWFQDTLVLREILFIVLLSFFVIFDVFSL